MDHQVQRHTHIGHARIVGSQTMAFDETGVVDDVFDGADGGVEAFDMPDLQDQGMIPG